MFSLRRAVFVAAAALLANSSLFAVAQGPSERPMNLTCVAPERPTLSYHLEPAARATDQTVARAGTEHGVLYRGSSAPGLQGLYLYVDTKQNALMSRVWVGGHAPANQLVLRGDVTLLGVIEDEQGDLLVSTSAGWQRISVETSAVAADFPATLSATGCFDVNDVSVAASGLIPYAPAATLWSDGATKRRWVAMPDWRAADTTIAVLPDGDFDFPIGTVLVKEFALGDIRVETRLFVLHDDGNWGGYSYEWNDEQTDALLLESFKQKEVAGQVWTYPARSQCLVCHSAAANRSLGLETAQLNNDLDYGSDGIANQLQVFYDLDLIAGEPPAPINELDALPRYADDSATLEARARGYLHSNCSMCHRPGGPGIGPEDFRYFLSGSDIGALDVDPTRGNLGVPGAKLLKRGAPNESVLLLRLQSETFQRMPPLGVSIVDTQGVALVSKWIESGSGFGFMDSDADEYTDDFDNCSAVANKGQRDTDGDGFGNACDADLNNDGTIDVQDLGMLRSVFFTTNPDADFNGDGVVNAIDLGIMRVQFFGTPGPGAVSL
ncbi:MAG: hypothetical protein AB8G16_08160 [Gammaproteobacteria bacterium]